MTDADEKRKIAAARLGRTLRGKWRLDALIGVGGMAAVYAATHRNGRRGAVKMLHPRLLVDPSLRARFLREGRAANAVEHPGVVAVLDDDEDETGSPFLVMELLDGESVAARLAARGGSLPWGEVWPVAEGLLDVLAAAHERGVLHRDIKPENVFFCRDGRVKLLDFGIASSASEPSQTAHGDTLGTPAFMAPEQAMGRWDEVGPPTDVWAAAATLFAMLTGRAVHEGHSVNELLVQAATRKAPPVASLCAVPAMVAGVIDRALLPAREQRFADARAMLVALREAHLHTRSLPLALAETVEASPGSPPLAPPAAPATGLSGGDQASVEPSAASLARPAHRPSRAWWLAPLALLGLALARASWRPSPAPPPLAPPPASSTPPSTSPPTALPDAAPTRSQAPLPPAVPTSPAASVRGPASAPLAPSAARPARPAAPENVYDRRL